MNHPQRYGIFRKPHSEQPCWVESAETLDDAVNRMSQLTQMFPADYFIFDRALSHFIVPAHRGSADIFLTPASFVS
jgi:hypothetical protein